MSRKLTITTDAGVAMTLVPVPMKHIPSHNPEMWIRFQGRHIRGATLSETTQNAIQAFMRANRTEALWDGQRNVTLAGGMLAECNPAAVE